LTTLILEKPKSKLLKIKYTEPELDIIRQYYDSSCVTNLFIKDVIKRQTGIDRSVVAIRHIARKLGLARHQQSRWTDIEVTELLELVGKHTINEISRIIGRSRHAVSNKISDLKLSTKNREDWYTKKDIEYILGVNKDTITNWINLGKLKYYKHGENGQVYHIKSKNLRDFILKYPMELTGRNVDLLQIINILCPNKIY
jgi:DNA-binding CsgD family transcriptional regulator